MPLFGRGDDRRERSAADREAARLERERRRAAARGAPAARRAAADGVARADEPPAATDAAAAPDEPRRPTTTPAPRRRARARRAERARARRAARADEAPPAATRADARRCTRARRRRRRGRRPALDAVRRRTPSRRRARGRRSAARAGARPRAAVAGRRRPARTPSPSRGPVREPVDPQATQPLEPVGAIHARRTVSLPRPQTEELGHHTDSWDRPIGTVRVSRGDYQAQPGAPGMPPHRNLGVQKTRRRWLRRFVVLLLVLALAAVAVFAFLLFQPFHGKGYDAVVVTIPPGSSAGEIGDLLSDQGRRRVGLLLRAARAPGAATAASCAPARYTLQAVDALRAALAALTPAPKAAPTIDVTLPEGPSRRELAPRVAQAGVRGSYVKASDALDACSTPRDVRRAEGRRRRSRASCSPTPTSCAAAPRRPSSSSTCSSRAFKREFAQGRPQARARRKHLSRYDVLIIASMIEREAQVPKDRRLISAVIYNRLQQRHPARHRRDAALSPEQLEQGRCASPSSTSTPPTTRAGASACRRRRSATRAWPRSRPPPNPANAKYLFYVVKPCGNGAHAFCSTDAQFQKDVAAYNRARDKRGGKDPSHC